MRGEGTVPPPPCEIKPAQDADSSSGFIILRERVAALKSKQKGYILSIDNKKLQPKIAITAKSDG